MHVYFHPEVLSRNSGINYGLGMKTKIFKRKMEDINSVSYRCKSEQVLNLFMTQRERSPTKSAEGGRMKQKWLHLYDFFSPAAASSSICLM